METITRMATGIAIAQYARALIPQRKTAVRASAAVQMTAPMSFPRSNYAFRS